jgi:hypothetical protein
MRGGILRGRGLSAQIRVANPPSVWLLSPQSNHAQELGCSGGVDAARRAGLKQTKLKSHPFSHRQGIGPSRWAGRKHVTSYNMFNMSHLQNSVQNGQKMVGMKCVFWE